MKIVETGGLYHYEVRGERETEAAAELERKMDILSRDYSRPSAYVGLDMADTVADVRKAYGVEIKAAI
jgi:hypothetical protein